MGNNIVNGTAVIHYNYLPGFSFCTTIFMEVLRMRGKGLPYYEGSSRGDLKLRMRIDIPQHISAEERQLYEQLQQLNKKPEQKKTQMGEKYR